LERDLGARARERSSTGSSERGTVHIRDEYRARASAPRDEHRERGGAVSTNDYQERSYSGDPADRYCYRERDYRERDRDFGEIVFLEREGEMLAHFQVKISISRDCLPKTRRAGPCAIG
jgi:hypothetical protein